VLGAGGEVLLQVGPAALDLGYRYRRIVATGLASAINAGRDYNIHEVRAGIGFGF
jgi:opacity protein-like surface antigen